MNSGRDDLLDNLRGIAVLLMVFAHSIIFFNAAADPLLYFVSQFSDTVVFTIFLFVSGAVSYLAYMVVADENWPEKKKRLLLRIFRLLLGYYMVALIATLPEFLRQPPSSWPLLVQEILVFIRVPSYTEFVLPFIIFSLLIVYFRKVLKFISENFVLVAVISAISFFGGTYLHTLAWPDPLLYYTSLFWGYRGLFRFPVLQYLPVFLIGSMWGSYFERDRRGRIIFALFMLTSMSMIYWGITYTSYTVNRERIYDAGILLQRWPPSVAFVAFGLAFVFFAIMVIRLGRLFDVLGLVRGSLSFFGKNAFLFYFYHIIILYIYRYSLNFRVEQPVLVFGAYTVLLLLCSLFIFAVRKISSNEQFIFNDLPLKKVLISKPALLILILILTVSIVYIIKRPGFGVLQSSRSVSGVEGVFLNEREPYWWNSSYRYYRNFSVINEDKFEELNAEKTVYLEVDHEVLVKDGKSTLTGTDLAVVHFDNGNYQQLPIVLEQLSTKNTRIMFHPVGSLAPNFRDDKYYLYYGSDGSQFKAEQDQLQVSSTSGFELKEEISALINTKLSRKWILKGLNINEDLQTSVFEIKLLNIDMDDIKVRCLISGPEQATIVPEDSGNNTYTLTLDAGKLAPGSYTVQASVDGTDFKSAATPFNVSYPLYVTWSIDYEGFDVKNEYLDSMAKISADYGVPVTHLFNPRLFIAAEVSQKRRQELVDWVLQRQTMGDEIGMHMHMHLDMIKAAGITPLTEPRWGGRVNGHDVLTSAYDYATFDKLVRWAKGQFSRYNLPEPRTYRSGGWYIDIENLRVLQDEGFLIDTSGREYQVWGSNKIAVPWSLSPTTRPYHPSYSDQNSNIPPTLDLWEFPNNGQDSTNNPLQLLMSKFSANFEGKPLQEAQTLSYMSHPHWLDTYDTPKLRPLFTEINKYTANADNGPVIFSTYQQALKGWEP